MQIRSTLNQTVKKNTPYQQIKNSPVGQLVRENKVGTAATALAACTVVAGGSVQSEAFSHFAQHALVPATAVGVAGLGAAVVHDALVNDIGKHNARATAKIAAGSVAALGGTQLIGLMYDIPVLDRALTGVVFEHGGSLLGGGLLAGAAVAGKSAVGQFQKAAGGQNTAVHAALGTGAALGAVGAGLAGAELIGRDLEISGLDRALSGTVELLTQSSASSVVGGGLMVAGAAVAGVQAVKKLQNSDHDYATAALATGAAAGGLGGAEILGHGLGLEATKGLFTQHAGTIGGLSTAAFGAAVTRHAASNIQKNGATPWNTLALTAGVGGIGAGVGLTALSFEGLRFAEQVTNTTVAAVGGGLGFSAYAFGKRALQAGQKGEVGAALFHASGAAASAAGGLFAVGSGLGIEALERAGEKVVDATVKPLTEHVLMPAFQFLFENPALGGIGLALAVGGYAYSQWKD